MFNRNRDRNRRLALLAGAGLTLAMLGRKRRRFAMGPMGAGIGRGGWGHYGGYAPGGHADVSQMPLPPYIEARLKAWHDRAHGAVPPTTTQPSDAASV